MIRKILVASDGSDTARKAAEYAIDLAGQTGSSMILLSVIDPRFFVSRSVPADATSTHIPEPIDDFLREGAEAILEELEDLCKGKGVSSRSVIRSGHPVEVIIGEAEESGADLIVLGSHGRSAMKAAVLGSVTYGVVHKDTRVPVLVVRREP